MPWTPGTGASPTPPGSGGGGWLDRVLETVTPSEGEGIVSLNPAKTALNLLGTPASILTSTAKEVGDLMGGTPAVGARAPRDAPSARDWWNQIAQPHRRLGFGDLLSATEDFAGMANPFRPEAINRNPWLRAGSIITGFAGDVLTDPLSYVGAPGAQAMKAGGRRALASSAAANHTAYALDLGVRRGGKEAAEASVFRNRLSEAVNEYDKAAKVHARAQNHTDKADSLVARQEAEDALTAVRTEADEFVQKSGLGGSLDEAIFGLARPHGGASTLHDETTAGLLLAAEGPVTGLRLRPFWKTQGGRQLLTPATWEKATAPLRAVRGDIATSKAGQWVRSGFGRSKNTELLKLANDTATSGNPKLFRQKLALLSDSRAVDSKVFAWKENAGASVNRLQGGRQLSTGQKAAIANAIQTPAKDWERYGVREQMRQTGVSPDTVKGMEELFRGWHSDGRAAGLEMGDLGKVYLPVRLNRDNFASEEQFRVAATAAFERTRWLGTDYLGHELPSVQASIKSGVLELDESTGMVTIADKDAVPWRSIQREMDDINKQTFGDAYNPDHFEKDPFRLMHIYVGEMGRRMQAEGYKAAARKSGLGMWADEMKASRDLQEALAKLPGLQAQADEISAAYADAAEKAATIGNDWRRGPLFEQEQEGLDTLDGILAGLKEVTRGVRTAEPGPQREAFAALRELTDSLRRKKGGTELADRQAAAAQRVVAMFDDAEQMSVVRNVGAEKIAGLQAEAARLAYDAMTDSVTDPAAATAMRSIQRFTSDILDEARLLDDDLLEAVDGDDIGTVFDTLDVLAERWNGYLTQYRTMSDMLPEATKATWQEQLAATEQIMLGVASRTAELGRNTRAALISDRLTAPPQAAVNDALSSLMAASKAEKTVGDEYSRLPREQSMDAVSNDLGLSWHNETLRPDEVEVHPSEMQVRRNVDPTSGIDPDRALNVDVWSPLAAGTLIVWKRSDGSKWVVDGHHRTDAAKRLQAQGAVDMFGDPIVLSAKVFDETKGNDIQRMHFWGALANLGEGRLDEVTLAKAMRGAPPEFVDLVDQLTPKKRSGGIVDNANAFSRLSDDAWMKVQELWDADRVLHYNGERVTDKFVATLPQREQRKVAVFDRSKMNQLRGIVDATDDPEMQAALVDSVAELGFKSKREADTYVARAAQEGVLGDAQDLLGGRQLDVASIRREVKLVSTAAGMLESQLRTLRSTLQGADVMETVEGTSIAREGTASAADESQVAIDAWDFDSKHDPEVKARIEQASAAVSSGEATQQQAAGNLAAWYARWIRDQIQDGGGIEKVEGVGGRYWRSPLVAERQARVAGESGEFVGRTAARDMADTPQPGVGQFDMFTGEEVAAPVSRMVDPDRPADMPAAPVAAGNEPDLFAAPPQRTAAEIARDVLDAENPQTRRGFQQEAAAADVNAQLAQWMQDYQKISATWKTPAAFAKWMGDQSATDFFAQMDNPQFPDSFRGAVQAGDWDKVGTFWPRAAQIAAPVPEKTMLPDAQRARLWTEWQQARRARAQAEEVLQETARAPQPLAPVETLLSDSDLAGRVREAVAISAPERQAWEQFMAMDPATGLMHADETAKARYWLGENGENLKAMLDEVQADHAADPTDSTRAALENLQEVERLLETAGQLSQSLPMQDRGRAAELLNIAVNANMAVARRKQAEKATRTAQGLLAKEFAADAELRKMDADILAWSQNEPAVQIFIDEAGERLTQWHGLHTDQDIADIFEKALTPQQIPKLVKAWGGFADWWRGMALLSPGYHARNVIGAATTNMLHGVKPTTQKRVIAEYMRMVRRPDLGPGDREMRNFLEEAMEYGTIGKGQFGGEIEAVEAPNTSWNPLAGLPGPARQQQWKPVHANRLAGNHIENVLRAAPGFEAAQRAPRAGGAQARQTAAREIINKLHFDYTDVSNLEGNYIRNVSMFWTWMSRNMVLQAEQAVHRPQLLLATDRLFRNIGAGAPVNPYAPEYYEENEYRQITQRWFSTLELPAFASMRDLNKLSSIGQGNAPAMRAVAEYSPFMREGLELLTGRDALRGYELRGSERAKRAAGAALPLYARARRLLPQVLGGSEGEKERQLSSFFGWVGLPIRQASMSEMRYQRRLREDMLRGYEADARMRDEHAERVREMRSDAEDAQISRELQQVAA